MAYEFKFPDVGEGIHEGKIVKWLVKEGDQVKADQTIAEVETDKAVVEIPSPRTGTIAKTTHAEGDIIKVGEILATIDDGSSNESEDAPAKKDASPQEKTATPPPAKEEPKKKSTGVVGKLEEASSGVLKAPSLTQSGAVFEADPQRSEGVPASTPETEATPPESTPEPPPAAPLAKSPQKTGMNVVKSNFKATKKYDMFGYIDRIPYQSIRKAVGEHMVKSMFTIPHVTHTDLADVTDLWDIRQKEKERAAKDGIKLTFLPFFIKAVVASLMKHPTLNASLDEEAGQIIVKKYYNIGIAVDIEDGLVVPVIKGADKKSILDLAKEIETLAQKARDRKLNPMDMKGGSFTITNIGSAGSGWFATPVINFPEAAILGTGMIQDTPVALDGKVKIRKMLPLSLSFDHRVLDGAEAALFTKTVKEHLEDPGLLLVEEK